MKIVTRNERSPRKYSQFKDVYLMDDAGIIWGHISIHRSGRISIRHLQGVSLQTSVANGMGDYLIGGRSYHYSWCPNCQDQGRHNPKVFDTRTDRVKCSKCGHTWGGPLDE